jgi:quercetin dioxygenase-like cupin family protein
MSARRFTALALAALLAASTASAQAAHKSAKLQWGAAPPFLPAGARFALVSGDPGKTGPFEIRLDLPNGYVIPPHWHPTDETVTVKSGHFRYGMGDRIDRKAEKSMTPGQSGTMKTNMRHWARARGRTVVAVTGNGPFAITYVNPADDPRTAKPKAK